MRALWYLSVFMVPVTAALGIALGGWWLLATPLYIFAFTPSLDELAGLDTRNADEAQENVLKANPLYDLILRAWVPAQIGVLLWGLWVATSRASGVEQFGLVVALGMLGGIGINLAHELMHRKTRLDRGFAEALMASVSYTHFCVEHIFGHHKNVATPLDPATARRGDTVYGFVPRSIVGGLKSFWEIEGQIASRKGYTGFDLRNRRLRYPLVYGLMLVALGGWLGWMGPVFFIAQSAIAIVMLEVINFLEHYGLERAEVRPGRYERVQPHHSWNSAHRVTRLFLFGLPRHSDHHYLASRPFPILRHHADAPQLPHGYASMFLIALVPPLWRAVMDPRVDALKTQPSRSAESTMARAA